MNRTQDLLFMQSGHANYYATNITSFRCRLRDILLIINICWNAIFLSSLPSTLQLEIDKLPYMET